MPLPKKWIAIALKVTGHFEDSADPLGAVSGDFDGMGISLGVLQWNIGSGSLQPMIRRIGEAPVVALMPVYGRELWSACTSNVATGLAIVRGWQDGSHLRPAVMAELKALVRGPEFTQQQIATATHTAEGAYATGEAWIADYDGSPIDLHSFCWFFDVRTQNGGLKGVSAQAVKDFIREVGAQRVDDVVCDWLAARGPGDAGYRDARKNALLWRTDAPAAKLPLFAASYLRAMRARLEYRADVLDRKGTIALGSGWVHGELHRLDPLWTNA
jgi:hypothetical protein